MKKNSKKAKNIGLILPYAVSIRDFVTSGAMTLLVNSPGISITIYTLNPNLPEFEDLHELNVNFAEFQPYENSWVETALKGFYLYAFSDKLTYLQQLVKKKPLRRAVSNIAVLLKRTLGVRLFLRLFERLMLVIFCFRSTNRQLNDDFDLVIGTRSLINSIDYGLMAEARRRGIPLLTLAGSWDNFTTKGFFPFRSEQVVVWNRKMVEELKEIYSIDVSNVAVVGYPRKAALESVPKNLTVEEYLKTIGYRGYKRFILYSASYSELTLTPESKFPLEYEVINRVCKKLEAVLADDVCIIVRLHPFSDLEGAAIFDHLDRSFVFIPGRRDQYTERVMGGDDEMHLACQLKLSDCVISMASTISIDALSVGKHVVNTNFDPWPDISPEYSNTRFFEYNHFANLVDIARLPIASSVEEVIDFVFNKVPIPLDKQVDMSSFNQWYVPPNSNQYPENVNSVIRNTLDQKSSRYGGRNGNKN